MSSDFFASPKPNSIIKQKIILYAFKIWLDVNKKQKELSYIDLFSGPGIYNDGSFSTPFLILQEICDSQVLSNKFNIIFNDNRKAYIAKLRKALNGFKNISNLNMLITASETITNKLPTKFSVINHANSFVFIDAWGYQGINRDYIRKLLSNKNCAISLFFNINQIPRFINSKRYNFSELFKNVFSKSAISKIKKYYHKAPLKEREQFLLNLYISDLTAKIDNCNIVLKRFCRNSGQVSHYIITILRTSKQANELSRLISDL